MIQEKCGVFGIFAPGKDVSKLVYYGLYALQHRGQEGSGIVVTDGEEIHGRKKGGLVGEGYTDKELSELIGHASIGHVRNSMLKGEHVINTQPITVTSRLGKFSIGHNGNLVNGQQLRGELEDEGTIFQTKTDSEVLAHLLSRSGEDDIVEALKSSIPKLKGAFSFVMLTPDKVMGIRDPYGLRPLSIGKLDDGYVLASESCAFDTVGAQFIRDVDPGELIIIDEKGTRSVELASKSESSLCIFEYIYFARPDSNLYDRNVHIVRKELGKELAREYPDFEADLVSGVPDSSLSAASGVSEELGIPYEIGLVKNRYVGRTFIRPTQEMRDLGVKLKLNPVKKTVARKKIILVDDSIVRGTTAGKIVQMLKDVGAKEVHLFISSPPVKYPCTYGIDTSDHEELIANRLSLKEIADHVGADSVNFLSVEGMVNAINRISGNLSGYCQACFDGCYPLEKSEAAEVGDNA